VLPGVTIQDEQATCCSGTFWIQYDIQEELGEGAFGKAYRARRRKVGTQRFPPWSAFKAMTPP
jgi:hypothetical protein